MTNDPAEIGGRLGVPLKETDLAPHYRAIGADFVATSIISDIEKRISEMHSRLFEEVKCPNSGGPPLDEQSVINQRSNRIAYAAGVAGEILDLFGQYCIATMKYAEAADLPGIDHPAKLTNVVTKR